MSVSHTSHTHHPALTLLWCAAEPTKRFVRIQKSQWSFRLFKFHVSGLQGEELMKNTFCKGPNCRKTSGINRNQKIHRTLHKCPDHWKSSYLIPVPRTPVSANFKADIHRQPAFACLGGSQNCSYLLFREEKGTYWLKRSQNKNLVRDQYALERIWFSATSCSKWLKRGHVKMTGTAEKSCGKNQCWKKSPGHVAIY